MLGHRVVVCALAMAAASAAHAQAPRFAAVQVAGDTIRVPIPAGFCEPTGRYIGLAQLTAAADNDNVTLLTLNDCEGMKRGGDLVRFAHLKAQKRFLSARASRAELLAGMGAIPASELSDALHSSGKDGEASKNVSGVFGRDVELTSDVRPIERDGVGYYLAGTIHVAAEGKATVKGVAVGITSIKGHIVSFNLYGPGDSLADIRTVLRADQAVIKGLVEANP